MSFHTFDWDFENLVGIDETISEQMRIDSVEVTTLMNTKAEEENYELNQIITVGIIGTNATNEDKPHKIAKEMIDSVSENQAIQPYSILTTVAFYDAGLRSYR